MTVEVLLRATIFFFFFDENDRKYPGDDTVVAQKNEVKAEEAQL